MKRDVSAVAGFFEDLPVLIFVLGGVTILTLSGAYASGLASERRSADELDILASRLIDRMLSKLGVFETQSSVPSSSIDSLNVSFCAQEVIGDDGFAVAFLERHPCLRWLRANSTDDEAPIFNTGYSSALFNVLTSEGAVGIVEVTVFVWDEMR